MAEYQEYPRWMAHPSFQPAVMSDDPTQRQPIRFAPVMVEDADQQAQYEAKGYVPSGTPNPKAFEPTRASDKPAAYVFEEYPKWVGGVLVNNPEEERAAMPSLMTTLPDSAPAKRKAA